MNNFKNPLKYLLLNNKYFLKHLRKKSCYYVNECAKGSNNVAKVSIQDL